MSSHSDARQANRPHASPDPVARLEHDHFRSTGAQGVGRGEAGKAGADDADPLHLSSFCSRFTTGILPTLDARFAESWPRPGHRSSVGRDRHLERGVDL